MVSVMTGLMDLLGQWGQYGPGGMMGGGSGMWYGAGWLGMLFPIIFWVLVIVGIVVLIRWIGTMSKGGPQQGGTQEDSAMELLRRRYAKGDITKEEFEEKKRDLS